VAVPIQVTFDAADPDRLARFWMEALHYRFPDPPAGFDTWEEWARENGVPENDASAVEDPDGKGPRLFFQRVPEGKVAKNRMHLDLAVSGGRDLPLEERKRNVDREVARLKALGASDARGSSEEMGGYWVRMNDPEGNEFCLH
jgi:hypothetical protein